ncbi:MAG: UDP-2,4-diacetamido-2,4,6-trideoxy-beta-L-altropyranose hydrolase [Lachnospiraceae bacterium]|nr:UDP-2,4-diacetamido-2,4,6-trideoxy-beta-L-altropyranose hydrolase [Lachnospiraceae bacterium]
MLYIRADGNATIGTGHIMRCLSVAEAYRINKGHVYFILADDSVRDLITGLNYPCMVLGTDYQNPGKEIDIIKPLIERDDKAIILADSYFFDKDYYEELGKLCPVACFDDDFRMDYPVDILINYNIYGIYLDQKETQYKNRKNLLGPKYAPLRRQFLGHSLALSRNVKNILLTTGGGDRYGAAVKICDEFLKRKEFEGCVINVVVGTVSPHGEAVKKFCMENPGRIEVWENVSDMASLMLKCDLALSAAGSTIYELCAMGVPTVCFYYAENQRMLAGCLEKDMGIVNAGDFSLDPEGVCKRLLDTAAILKDNFRARQIMNDLMKRTVDARGAARIAGELVR